MSVLIRGMDKPTDCGVCPFEDFGYCNVKGERNTSESGIDTDCPLIEVADCKTENCSEKPNNCETCRFELYCPEMCEGCCEWDSHYEPKTEPQTEYERASEQREHDILYEPTYDLDDGSM